MLHHAIHYMDLIHIVKTGQLKKLTLKTLSAILLTSSYTQVQQGVDMLDHVHVGDLVLIEANADLTHERYVGFVRSISEKTIVLSDKSGPRSRLDKFFDFLDGVYLPIKHIKSIEELRPRTSIPTK